MAETRRKGNRGKKTMSHREAMRAASVTWPKAKAKLERQQKWAKSKAESASKPPSQKNEDESA